MEAQVIVGSTLAAGLVVFLVGAGGWRMTYEQPMLEALQVIHGDRRRRAWIHLWMLPAMLLTSAGGLALVWLTGDTSARVWVTLAGVTYALGATCWVVSLLFRLAVVPWAASEVVDGAGLPPSFPALDRWASTMYATHMTSAYVAAVLLGLGLLADGALVATWLGWAGVGFGALWGVGIVATRFAGPFNPPFWAHLYTGAVGVALLLR